MKNPLYPLLLSGLIFLSASCAESIKDDNSIDPNVDEIVCIDECLFTMKEATGEMIYMECFQKYAIKTQYPDDETITIYGIPESVDSKYEEDGMQITFSAAFRENELVPSFPDPSFNMESLFQIELVSLE